MNNSTDNKQPFKSGFVAITGKPNAGKSTLLNNLAKMKLAIVSEKAQTTRHNIMYIHDVDNAQIIFRDTPGLHSPKNRLNEKMMEAARKAVGDSDLILLMIDATRPELNLTEIEFCRLAGLNNIPVYLVINKVDKVRKENLLPVIHNFNNIYPFDEIFPISAKAGTGITELLDSIVSKLPEGPRYYPEDHLTDQTERELTSEYIRESILRFTSDELPHGTAVEIESFTEDFEEPKEPDSEKIRKMIRIKAVIFCERESHKKMLIGKNGETVKRIGTAARTKLEELLQCKIYLELFVKAKKDWRNDPLTLNDLGYKIDKMK